MAAQGYILAIDLGTSALKVALVSTAGQVLGLETEAVHLNLLPGGGAEQDPQEWWGAVKKTAARLLAKGLVPRGQIVAVGCTSQWSGTVPVDREGQPLMNAVIWMDSRGAPDVRQITGGPVRISGYGVDKIWRWVRKTGGIPGLTGKDSIAHILFIQRRYPEIYRSTYKFLEPKDYLNFRLTGRYAASYDSIALHWVTDNRNLSRVRYDPRLLAMAGIDRQKLPDLVPATALLGPIKADVAVELGLSEDIQVVAGTPDVQSAAIGSGATRDLGTHLYVGTSAWLTCHVPFKKTDLLRNMASLPSAIPGRYFVANEQETAGACLTFLRDNVLFHQDGMLTGNMPPNVFELFDELAAGVPPGSDGVIFTPWLYGERTPVEDHTIRGGFHNLSLQTTRPHLIRAVLEGVAYNARWLLEAVETFVGRRLDPIRIIGGGAQSDLWCQIFADVLDRTIEQVRDPLEANVRGAAIVASVGLGYMTFDEAPDLVEVARSFWPRAENRERYDQLFKVFLELYRRNKSIYARLNSSSTL